MYLKIQIITGFRECPRNRCTLWYDTIRYDRRD